MSDLRRFRMSFLAALAIGVGALAGPSVASAESTPTIDGEWVSNITEHDATLNVEIDPNGASTWYRVQIDTIRSDNFTHAACPFGPCDAISVGPPLPSGLVEPPLGEVSASEGDQLVSFDMASVGATLEPGTTYFYRPVVHQAFVNNGPTVYGPEQSFTTLSPDGTQTQTGAPSPATDPLQGLEGRYRGLAITGIKSRRPIRRPRQLRVSLSVITKSSDPSFEGHPILFWEANCNSHRYQLTVAANRFELVPGATSKVGCRQRVNAEEHWLEKFFDSDPRWKSTSASLTLMSYGRRMVLHRLA